VRVIGPTGRATTLPPGSRDDPLDGAYISPDGSRVATVRRTRVTLWRSQRPWTAPAQRVGELLHGDGVTAVTFSADSTLVATASSDGVARVWEASTGGLVAALTGHTAGVEALAFSAHGRFLATVADDLTVRLWDLGAERTLRLDHGADALAATPAGARVAVVEGGGALRLWDVSSRVARTFVLRPQGAAGDDVGAAATVPDLHPTSVAITHDGASAFVGYASPDGTTGRAALLDLASGRDRLQFDVGGPVQQVSIAGDGRFAVIVHATGTSTGAVVWDLRAAGGARRAWRVPVGDDEGLTDAAFSPDGRHLLVTTVFGAARVFDLATQAQVRALTRGRADSPGPEAFYRGVFSPDGKTVAVAGSRDVRLWDVRSGAERGFRLAGHTSVLKSVAYDTSGRRIMTASADGTTRVWDARDGTVLAVLDRHAGGVNDAAFLRDGRIVSAGEDRTVRVYPCPTCAAAATLPRLARGQVTRGLSARERAEFAG
jgi:WD40 repeat protein